MALLLALAFLAGFVLDLISIILIIIPIAMPIIESFSFYNLEPNEVKSGSASSSSSSSRRATSRRRWPPPLLSPRHLAAGDPARHMYTGVLPFIVIEIIALAMVMMWPDLALWLPEQMLGFRE